MAGVSRVGVALKGTVTALVGFLRCRCLFILASTFLSPLAPLSYVVLASSLLR